MTVALSSTLEIPFSYLFAWIIIGQSIDWIQGLGAAFIFVCVIITPIPCFKIQNLEDQENDPSEPQRLTKKTRPNTRLT